MSTQKRKYELKTRAESQRRTRGRIVEACDERLLAIAEGLRRGMLPQEIADLSGIDQFFIHKVAEIVAMETSLAKTLDPRTTAAVPNRRKRALDTFTSGARERPSGRA